MCDFFSFVGDGYGNYGAIGWETRKKWLDEGSDNLPDSHTRILTTMGVPPRMQDRWSKYEYNPLTGNFTIDEPVEGHDHEAASIWVRALDFKKVVEPLIIRPIVHPFKVTPNIVTEEDKENLRKWADVWDSVEISVWDSVEISVWSSVGASVGASVAAHVGASVGASVAAHVGAHVGASVAAHVGAHVGAYISSFFDIKYQYDFSSCIALWDRGLVPSFDGKTWRLLSAPDARVVYEYEVDKVK